MPNTIPEREIAKVWQQQWLPREGLVTESGAPLSVIYPGRVNDDRGADFRDAVIVTPSGLMKGDVEIHNKSSDWRAHQHHRDACYNRVILHVVRQHDAKMVTSLQNGQVVPVLVLGKYLQIPPSQAGDLGYAPNKVPCYKTAQYRDTDTIGRFLERAGEERFGAKAAQFQADFSRNEPGQALYRGIMGALGYAKNKVPFQELADRLPLRILESLMDTSLSAEECLAQEQARLLGMAGLLPSQHPDKCAEVILERPWLAGLEERWSASDGAAVMSAKEWRFCKVRPHNSPVRRLLAMASILVRFRMKGLFAWLIDLVKEAPLHQGNRVLAEALQVEFGRPAGHTVTLLGTARAADISVNVLLPFTFTWGQASNQPELSMKASELYRRYPRLATNSIEKHMQAQLGLNGSQVNSARRQQGLIHIYQRLCTEGRCQDCLLGQLEAGHDVKI